MIAWLKHAFAVEERSGLVASPEEAQLVDRFARGVVRRGLATPAMLALDCSVNLNFLASQTMLFVEPIVQALFSGREYQVLMRFLERRGSIEYICRRIESYSADGERPAPGDKRQAASRRGAGCGSEPPEGSP